MLDGYNYESSSYEDPVQAIEEEVNNLSGVAKIKVVGVGGAGADTRPYAVV